MKNGIISGVFCAGMAFLLAGCPANRTEGRSVKLETPGSQTRVMTFNILYGTADNGVNRWEHRKEALFNQITDLAPDVAGLQEALEFQVQAIRQALPAYETVGVGRDDGKKTGEQCCILYRKDRFDVAESGTFWFSDTPETAGSKHWGNTQPRICTWARLIEKKTGRGFYIYNVHLDHQSEASRVRSTKLLAQRVAQRKPIEPFVVMGDFNCGPDSPAMAYLLGCPETKPLQAMTDVLAVARPEQRNIGTYHAFTGRTSGARIDMILTAPDVKTQDARIDQRKFDGRYTSDHFPVTAELNLF